MCGPKEGRKYMTKKLVLILVIGSVLGMSFYLISNWNVTKNEIRTGKAISIFTKGSNDSTYTLSNYGTISAAINAGYKYDHYVCTPDATLNYDTTSNTYSISSKVATKCELYFEESAMLAENITYSNSRWTTCTTMECALNELYDRY